MALETHLLATVFSLLIVGCTSQKQKNPSLSIASESWNRDSCDGKTFKQVIRFPKGCKNVIIENKLCVGNCITVYKPSQHDPIMTCRLCKPAQNTTIEVSTTCDHTHIQGARQKLFAEDSQGVATKKLLMPSVQKKRILKVLSCKCDYCA